MAEIKSTLEMVLARAAEMAATAPDKQADEEIGKIGMRLAADFMAGRNDNLIAELEKQPQEQRPVIRQAMAQILLRNIVLPRTDELHAASGRALGALPLLASSNELIMLTDELAQILGQYTQHKEQATGQLTDAITAQLQQQAAAQGIETSQPIDPSRHPKYQEELSNLLTNLNGQYNEAIDQRKQSIARIFQPA